ncbi:two-component sensor histidine kinase [Psychromonas sp. B3M02]|uniref:ATP-binding protein n=1 Tax=Psychromonas sp. B3M02 TaxID=2267226 RepID=UPI000DEABD17|nr:ATP-binding protein [Psychromonas sp. B3M02]RBW41555.1 two-component sensor histidine kinase [Psychromonas sp. B3M02]
MKIHNKLFLVFFGFSLVLVTALVLLIQWSIGKGIIEYVNSKEVEALKPLVAVLEDEYKKNNNWQSIQNRNRHFGHLLFLYSQGLDPQSQASTYEAKPNSRLPRAEGFAPPPRRRRPPTDLNEGFAVFDANDALIVGHYIKGIDYNRIAIMTDKVNVGWLMVPKHKQITDGYELDFIKQQRSYLWLIALITMVLVILITLPLARHLAEPIKKIIRGMHKLTQGDYQQHVDVKRKDELGELSRDFNELALTLYENDSARKRWLANISHELRTPVAILRGELEAILDGVRALEKQNIESANDEVKHLQHLIDDLHLLTSADIGGMHYRKQSLDVGLWLESEVPKYTSYLAAANIKLELEKQSGEFIAFVDPTRLCQLFENIMNNCIKYSIANLVKLSWAVITHDQQKYLKITVEDNGVGVAEHHLPHLFESLYRVENSRNRQTGGSGLGLSICSHIVSAHQGNIKAAKAKLGGLAVIIELPLE